MVIWPVPAGRITRAPGAVRNQTACRIARSGEVAQAFVHAVHQGGSGRSRREHFLAQAVELLCEARRRSARCDACAVHRGGGLRADAWHHHRRHQVRIGVPAGKLYLIDEALTDPSRFWPADQYRVGGNPPSFDKQFVRDWLEASGWNKRAPAPHIPHDILQKTADKYREAQVRLTGA